MEISLWLAAAALGCAGATGTIVTDNSGTNSKMAVGNGRGFDIRVAPYLRRAESGAHCGVYAVSGAVRCLGREPKLDEMLQNAYVGSRAGSSAEELISAVKLHQLSATVYQGVTTEWLKRCNGPVILRLARSRAAEDTHHWVLYLGDHKGKARIYDAPRSVETVSYATLLSLWDGTAIVVTDRKRGNLVSWLGSKADLVLWLAIPVFAVILIKGFPQRQPSHNRAGFFFCLFSLVAAAGIWAWTYHWIAPDGFANAPTAIGVVTKDFVPALRHPEESWNTLMHKIEAGDAVLVDARLPPAWNLGHLQGAINIPIDASLGELEDAMRKLGDRKERPIVVYCQSQECAWDEVIASWLVGNGFKNVSIFPPGWLGWQQRVGEDSSIPNPR